MRYAPSGYGWENKAQKRENAKVQNQLKKTRRVPAGRCIIPLLLRDALLVGVLF
jgi:hypothetical protein